MARRLFDSDPRREQRRQQLLLERLSRSGERALATEIAKTTRAMVKRWEVTGQITADPEHEKRVWARLNGLWLASIEAIGKRILEQGKNRGVVLETKQREGLFSFLTQEYIRLYGGLQIAEDISRTTVTQIMRQVAIGRREGLGQRDISAMINSKAAAIGRARGAVIARTETHSAGNYGAIESAKETGLKLSKEWISANQEGRTRDDHADADGQVVPMDEPFSVGGEDLMFPGDPSGSAANVISCRCAQGFVVVD